jgi:predicted ATPase
VTIVGAGGIGKTTVAVSVAHSLLQEFAGAVCFVDIGSINSPSLLASTVASTLGLKSEREDALPSLLEFLRHARLLLVLDNCEHVIDMSAELAEWAFSKAPSLHLLATSREALRVEGEHVYWLPPLESPPPESPLSAEKALRFSAIQLFCERASAGSSRFHVSDANAPIIARICNKLDGVALAIELAASRVGAYGVEGIASLLDQHLGLHWQGRRSAFPRHQTLHAMLGWSYNLLPQTERLVLADLSVFVGTFTIESAQAVVLGGTSDEALVLSAFDSLVDKSLVSPVTIRDGPIRYRLLETTRAFAFGKLSKGGGLGGTAQRHASYFATLMSAIASECNDPYHDNRTLALREHLGNVRAALDWCFGRHVAEVVQPNNEQSRKRPMQAVKANLADRKNTAIGIDLAAASVPLFLELSLMNECHRWSKSGLALLDDDGHGDRREMALQEGLATSAMWLRGKGGDVDVAITRALHIARERGDTPSYLRLLGGLHIFLIRAGEFKRSSTVAEELEQGARSAGDGLHQVIADWLQGSSRHYLGDQEGAERHHEKGFACAGPGAVHAFGVDCRVRAMVVYAKVAWLRGRVDFAADLARQAVSRAKNSGNELNVCFSLLYSSPVFLWRGDWDAAYEMLEEAMAHPNWHALPSFHATGLALKGEVLMRLGASPQGLDLMLPSLDMMKRDGQGDTMSLAACGLANSLAAVSRFEDAVDVVDDALALAEQEGEAVALPELLRIKGDLLLSLAEPKEPEAEDYLTRSLHCASRQAALSWELRAATTFARLRIKQGRNSEALEMVSSVYGRFTQGFETHDLKVAMKLLTELNPSNGLRMGSGSMPHISKSV